MPPRWNGVSRRLCDARLYSHAVDESAEYHPLCGWYLIPGYSEARITMNLMADFLFLVTLFVLGGDFWDKLRALFLYDAKAHLPT
jgi:hypothetical protein